jgi:AAA15 family ATPase/GTPase
MLIRFIVSNFLSINEEREFNMLAGPFKTHKHHVYNTGKVNVLKAAAIYGANGAGKSNLIKAIEFLQEAVSNGGITKSVSQMSINQLRLKLNYLLEKKYLLMELASIRLLLLKNGSMSLVLRRMTN